jgi:hypothetical protein
MQTRRSLDTRMDSEQLKTACVLINTADYCQTTALEVKTSTCCFHTRIDDNIQCVLVGGQDQGENPG